MKRKTKGVLSTLILLSLGLFLLVVILIILNQPGKTNQITTVGIEPSKDSQSVYPAPNSFSASRSMPVQGAYPPPSTKVAPPTSTPLPGLAKASPTAGKNSINANSVQRTSLQDAKAAFDEKKAVFLDVRAVESYNRNHIPDAISIPEAQMSQRLSELEPEQWIITYCS